MLPLEAKQVSEKKSGRYSCPPLGGRVILPWRRVNEHFTHYFSPQISYLLFDYPWRTNWFKVNRLFPRQGGELECWHGNGLIQSI